MMCNTDIWKIKGRCPNYLPPAGGHHWKPVTAIPKSNETPLAVASKALRAAMDELKPLLVVKRPWCTASFVDLPRIQARRR